MALRGPGTRRTASGDPEESIKVAVMDKRSGRSGGHKLKGPLECKRHNEEEEEEFNRLPWLGQSGRAAAGCACTAAALRC